MTYILAEVACAHMGDPHRALEIAKEAFKAGADGVKFQIWLPEEGDFSGMMDKHIKLKDWEWVTSAAIELGDVALQYYGKKSSLFCASMTDNWIDAHNKLWNSQPIIGTQLYPTPIEAALLWKVERGCGYADHSDALSPWAFAAPLVAVQRGAAMLEKHICLDREELGKVSRDACSALEPSEFAEFVRFIRQAEAAL